MADDRANNPARVPEVGSSAIQKALEGKNNIAAVYGPPRRDMDTPGSGKWDFGGGRPRYDVVERTAEESGPREMTKFDKNNKYHVGMLQAEDDSAAGMMIHPGGYFSFPKKETAERKMVKEPEKIKGTDNKYTKKLQNSEAAKKADIERRNAALKKNK